jgi:murein DD-endopeptidase MepM/ murein hydrolase activator NlpD
VKRVAILACLAVVLGAGAARGAVHTQKDVALPAASAANVAGGLSLGSFMQVRPDPFPQAAPAQPELAPAQPDLLSQSSLLSLWQSAGNTYGIPWEVLAAINKVESNFGRNMGPSSAGAIGWMQFLPSTWERWGVDADANGVADPWNATDAVYSAARYLAASGGGNDLPRAVFSYNHAQWYVDEVLRLAHAYGLGGGPQLSSASSSVVFALDRLQSGLSAAGRAVSNANARYLPALRRERALARRLRGLRLRAERTQLLSYRLDLQQQAVQLEVRLDAARATARRLHGRVASTQTTLRSLTQRAGASSFDRTVAGVVAAPIFGEGYAFPVGGGPDVVSVSHTHHDYPAADIAAPEGTPVYALADSVVLESWSVPDPRCGIGLTLQTRDGRSWTYCHLSFLDSNVRPGAALSAGEAVGLVGSTGDATGPHLHLQLQPATSYPQDEEWFQSFAGSAFRWQDGPVFAVVA